MRFSVTSVFLCLCFIGQGPIAPLYGQESGAPLSIQHEPLACLIAGKFPFVEAQVDATTGIQSARVYFKAHEESEWYYVEMEASEPSAYRAALPMPLPETKQVDYYAMVLGSDLETAQTVEYTIDVLENGCKPPATPLALVGSIVLRATVASQAPIPVGFSTQGIASFVTTTGQTVSGAALGEATASGGTTAGTGAAGAGGAAGGGGVSAATVGLIAGAAGGAGIAAVSVARGSPQSASVEVSPSGGAVVGVTELVFTVNGLSASSVRWDFGDGNNASGQTVRHVYSAEGSFTARVTASGGDSTASAQVNVTVRSLSGVWRNTGNSEIEHRLVINQRGGSLTGQWIVDRLPGPIPDVTSPIDGTIRSPREFTIFQRGECSRTYEGSVSPDLMTLRGPIANSECQDNIGLNFTFFRQ